MLVHSALSWLVWLGPWIFSIIFSVTSGVRSYLKAVKSSLTLAVYHASEVGCVGLKCSLQVSFERAREGEKWMWCQPSSQPDTTGLVGLGKGTAVASGNLFSYCQNSSLGAGSASVFHCTEGTLRSGQILMTNGKFSSMFCLFCQSFCVGRI